MNAPHDDLDALIGSAKRCPPTAPSGSASTGWDRLRGSLGAVVVVPPIDVPPGLVESAIVGKSATTAGVAGWSAGWIGKAIASAAVTLTVGGVGIAASGITTRDAATTSAVTSNHRPDAHVRAATDVATREQAPIPAELPAVASPATTLVSAPQAAPHADAAAAPSVLARTESTHDATSKRRAPRVGAEAEAPIVAEAMRALGNGDAQAALRELERHRRLHPDGAMTEDREALRVTALCKAGRAEDAAAARETFLNRWPTSPHASRVRTSCAAG